MSAVDFPNSPSNGDTFVVGTTTYTYNSTKGYWDAAPTGSSISLAAVGQHIIPTADVTYDLGTSAKKFRHLYLSGSSLYLGTQQITSTATGIQAAGLTVGTSTDNVKLTVDASGNIVQTATVGGTTGSATRNITFTDLSIGAEGAASGDGGIAYDNSTGVFTFTPADTTSFATLASPTLTGTPLAPTAADSTNTTQVATTAYVTTAISNLINGAPESLNTLNELAAALGDDASISTTLTNSIATKAPIDAPTFTGIPTAPTAAAGINTTQIATTAFVATAITNLVDGAPAALDTLNEIAAALGDDSALETTLTNSIATKAPLASPALTGVPTAPTASSGTNSTQIATTAFVSGEIADFATTSYVTTAVSNLIDTAPATLDTLNELAAAIGDDANFSTTITNTIATKAPLADPALTGVPTAPTASAGTTTTQIATTAFVGAAIPTNTITVTAAGGAYYLDGSIRQVASLSKTETYIFDLSDSSNAGHPLRFSTTSDGSHSGGAAYTTGVTVTGTPGQAGAKVEIEVKQNTPQLYYYCTNHSGMGARVVIGDALSILKGVVALSTDFADFKTRVAAL